MAAVGLARPAGVLAKTLFVRARYARPHFVIFPVFVILLISFINNNLLYVYGRVEIRPKVHARLVLDVSLT
jgi:hypothetical protein